MAISIFPRQIAISIVPTVLCLSETCGQRIVFLYVLLYMGKLISKKHYQITFGAAIFIGVLIELHLIVAILPLIWKSIFNILLFGCFHFFVVVSVMWVILDKSINLEALLGPGIFFDEGLRIFGYCLLPGLASLICSWYLTSFYGIEYLPYYLLCLSFAQYRVYITDPEIRNTKESKYAAEIHTIIVGIIFLTPLAVFVAKHVIVKASLVSLLNSKFLLEFFFITSLSGLAANFLGLQKLIKHYTEDASLALPSWIKSPGLLIRDASLISAALLLTPSLRAHGVALHFYTGPPATLAAVGVALLSRGAAVGYEAASATGESAAIGGGGGGFVSRLIGWGCGLIGAVAFAAQVFLFPWKIQYSMWDPTLTQRQFAGILLATALSPLIFLLLAGRKTTNYKRYLFATIFTVFLITFYYCEWNFYLLGYAPYQTVLLFSCLVIAAVLKLPHAKLPIPLKSVHLATVATRCVLLTTHRLAGIDQREIFPIQSVICLWLLCLQAVVLLWTLSNGHGFYVDKRRVGLPAASLLTMFVLLLPLRQTILASIAFSIFDRQLDGVEFVVLCLLFGSILHSKSVLTVPPSYWTPIKLVTAACGILGLLLGLVRNDFLPFVTYNFGLLLAAIQALLLVVVYTVSWLKKIGIAGGKQFFWGFALCLLLTCQHFLLYCTVFRPMVASSQTVTALLSAACISTSFYLCLTATFNTEKLFRFSLALFACIILLSGVHLLLVPNWYSFVLALIMNVHQLLASRWLRSVSKSNPDLVQLTQQLSSEERLFNALLAIAYCLLLIGCWSPLDHVISLSLPAILLAWLGPRSQAPFLISLLLSCQLSALYRVDFYGGADGDEPGGWWNRLVGLLESALCLGQLPLHFILCSSALANDGTNNDVDGEEAGSVCEEEFHWPLASLYQRFVVAKESNHSKLVTYADDLTPVFVALIILPLPVCLLTLLASSQQAVCLSVATLLLGADFLAENYTEFLGEMLAASFAALNDGKAV